MAGTGSLLVLALIANRVSIANFAYWDASVSILLDIGGARLIRDLGGHHKHLVNGHPSTSGS